MKLIEKLLMFLFIINLLIAIGFATLTYIQTETLSTLQSGVEDLIEAQRQFINNQMSELYNVMENTLNAIIATESAELNQIEDIKNDMNKEINNIKNLQIDIQNKLKNYKTTDIENADEIKEANILLYNLTVGGLTAGTVIKIKGNTYVLTCGHIISEDVNELIVLIDDFGNWHDVELVKYNPEKDLALFKVFDLDSSAYLEISDEAPTEGSEVLVIGNPAGYRDIITDGIVAKINGDGFDILTNKIYFGNSGGAVLYKGKIVGVVVRIYVQFQIPVFVNYGCYVNLETIKEFLKGV